jgi:hypothetical protein
MELATCNDIEVDVVLLRTEEGVANSTARGRGSCDSVRWPWHSNTLDLGYGESGTYSTSAKVSDFRYFNPYPILFPPSYKLLRSTLVGIT